MRSLKQRILHTWRSQRAASTVILLMTLVLTFFTFYQHRLTTNPRSRIITVERLLEAGTLAHVSKSDKTPFQLSEDAIKSPVDGNIYSSKPPLYSMIMALQAFPLKKVSGWNFVDQQVNYLRYLVLLNQVIPYALMLILALWLGMKYTTDKKTLTFLLLALSIGSLPFAYAVTVNNHTTAACWLFFAFFLLHSLTNEGKDELWRYALVGLFSGLAFSYELTAFAFGLVFVGALVIKNPRKGLFSVLLASVPVGITFYIYYQITGEFKPSNMQPELYRFAGSYWNDKQGLDVLAEPKWKYAFHTLLGHHGFFSLTPVLILVPISWLRKEIQQFGSPIRLYRFMILATVAIASFIIWKTSNYGGTCIGMRWWILFTPMAIFSTLPVIESLVKTRAGQVVLSLMIAGAIPAIYTAFKFEAFMPSWLEIWWGV